MRAQRKAEALYAQTPENSFEIVHLQFKIHGVPVFTKTKTSEGEFGSDSFA